MDKEEMVRKAVNLAKQQGARFQDNSPSFRPANKPVKRRFYVAILMDSGNASLDLHFNNLQYHDEISLANAFIDIFNTLNEGKVKRIENNKDMK